MRFYANRLFLLSLCIAGLFSLMLPLAGCDASETGVRYKIVAPTPIQVVPAPTEPRQAVSVATRGGTVHTVWQQQRPGLTVSSIWYSSAPIGTTFETVLNTNAIEMTNTLPATSDASGPVVVVGPSGDITVLWSQGQIGARSIAFATKTNGVANFGPTSFIIQGDDTTPATDNANPAAHYDDNGALHVVWEAGSDIKYRQRPLSGTLTNAVTLNGASTGTSFSTPSNPSVMTDEFENVMVAFEATQTINGSSRRVIRVAASDNGGGTFPLVGFLGGSGQQVVEGNFEPKLIRVPGNRAVGAVMRVGNQRTARIQFAIYANLGGAIVGSSIFDLATHTADVGQVSGLRRPVAASWFDATNVQQEIWVAWNDNGVITAAASLNGGEHFGEPTVLSTGAGVAASSLRPAIAVNGDDFVVAWDSTDSTNSNRAVFYSPQLTTGRRDPPAAP